MTVPNPMEAEQHQPRDWELEPRHNSLGASLEFLAGGFLVALGFIFSLPILVELTEPFGVLSTTALVFFFLFAWYFAWIGILLTHQHMPMHTR